MRAKFDFALAIRVLWGFTPAGAFDAGGNPHLHEELTMSRNASTRPPVYREDDDRLVSRAEIAALYGVQPLTVYLWGRAGKLPEPIRLTKRTLRWKLSEVRAALEGKKGVKTATAAACNAAAVTITQNQYADNDNEYFTRQSRRSKAPSR
jgi:predicted DNA-binding transcriptional regulator AlpA